MIYRTIGNAYSKELIKSQAKTYTDLFLSKQVNDPVLKEYETQIQGQSDAALEESFIKYGLNKSETKIFNFAYGKVGQIIFVDSSTE